MANTDYTDKQIAEHMATYRKTRAFPENTVFDPVAESRGEPILRKMTAAERKTVPATEPDQAHDEPK